jgi:pimeloyl-ACP methyl ester carboxylesterase
MTLAYQRSGSGQPLILVHGLGHRRQAWDAVLGRLTPHRDVIALDLPGHGESPPLRHLGGVSPIAEMVAEIAALIDSLGIERPHVAGNSLGGALALALAARGRAASATVLSPAGFPNNDFQVRYAKAFFYSAVFCGRALRPAVPALSRSTAGRALLFGLVVAKPGKMTPEQARGDMAAVVVAADAIRAIFAAFSPFTAAVPADVPVTVAWGMKDRILPPANGRVARERLPGARFLSMPGCGHVPMTDDPALVASVILEGSGGTKIV